MKEDKLIPKRRFKEFENSEAWEQRKLGEIVIIKSGWSPSSFCDGSSLYVKVDDLNYSTRDQETSKMKVQENSKYSKAKKGSIVFPKRGAAIMTNKVRILAVDAYMDTNMMALEPTNVYGEFLYMFIFRTGLYKIADTSTIPQINNKHIEPYEILLPKIEEQIKIGDFFRQLDNLITLHQRKLNKLKETKLAYLSEMFPKEGEKYPKRRFAGFTEAWEQRKLTDSATLFGGLTYSPNNIVKENGTLVLRSSNVKNGEVIDADNVYVNPEVVNVDNVRIGDIIVVVRNGSRSLIGKHAQIKASSDNTVIGAFMSGLRSNHPEFINALLDTKLFKAEIDKNLGATINQITNGMFNQMNFLMPSEKEQEAIGSFFKTLDNLITLHQRKLEKLKNIKKAYLNEMFV